MSDAGGASDQLDSILLDASLAMGAGDLKRAAALLEAAEALSPGEPRVWDTRGDLFRKRRQFDRATQCYRKALELDPSREETEEKLGLAALGKLEDSELTGRTAGRGPSPQEMRQRSQVAMVLTIICPGLGHLRFEHLVRAAIFGAIHIASATIAVMLIETARRTGEVSAIWGGSASAAVALVNYAIALFDASRIAARRDDEHLY